MPTARFTELAELAADRHGFVTTEDAAEVGYARGTMDKLARRGQLERVGWGVYRVPFIPGGPMAEYMQAVLWPVGTSGVLTHETALDLWDVCDINPAKIHVTVPADHRPQREVPKLYVLHREDLDPRDVTLIDAVPVVKLERAVRQCAATHVGRDLLEQAVRHGRERALLRREVAEALTTELGLDRVAQTRA
jgi:predicted transcriptional regulator of viral defense system